MKQYVIALDQGTTSSRAILFDEQQNIIGIAQKEFTQHYPREGWVEHDAMEIWSSQYAVMMEVVAQSGVESTPANLEEYTHAVAHAMETDQFIGELVAQLEADGKVTYASNVSEVANQVKEGAVDAGIIYATDAYSAGLTVVDSATAEMCGQVIYPAAVLKGEKEEAAQAFLDYLQTADAMSVFESVGFCPAN